MPTEAAGPAAAIRWTACPPDPLAWIRLRELLLHVLHQPALLLPAAALLAVALALALRWSRRRALLLALLLPLALSALYSPAATRALEAGLNAQLPRPSLVPASPLPVAVIPGRGPEIAAATTARAAQLIRQQRVQAVYVSGDARSTAEQLVRLGVSAARVAGDSCARTTWENASRTARWLRREASSTGGLVPPVLLITDPWQLPRASRAFQHQGLSVIPEAAVPTLSPAARNRLALREAAGTLLYALQGRL